MEEVFICHCSMVTEEEIVDAIRKEDARTVEAVGESTRAGCGCGKCRLMIREILDKTAARPL